jgi:hypothetical protein
VKKLISLLCFLFVSLNSAQTLANTKEAYKCTAEDGSISFLDKRPTEGCVKIDVVRISSGSYGPEQMTPEQLAAEEAKQMKEMEEKRRAQAKEICDKAKYQLDQLINTPILTIKDPDTGIERPMQEDERQSRMKQTQEFIDVSCKQRKTSSANSQAAETADETVPENEAEPTEE